MTCRPIGEVHFAGEPLHVTVELANTSGGEITVLGSTVPWAHHHAIRFSAPGYVDPPVGGDPREHPNVFLATGASDRGEVDVSRRLLDGERSMTASAGTVPVTASAHLSLDPGTTRARDVDATCSFEVTVVAHEGPLARAYDAAVAAARGAGTNLGDYHLVSVDGDGTGETSFRFEHLYPAPPGGHFGVVVDAAGTATVLPGE